MKIEHILLFVVCVVSLVAILGVGVALGGGNDASTGNYIAGISAFATCMSSLIAFGTLLFLISVRNDWLKPKEHEIKVELKLAISIWSDDIRSLNLYMSGVRNHTNKKDSINHVEVLCLKEENSWSSIQDALKSHNIICGDSTVTGKDLYSIRDLRFKVLVSPPRYISYLNKQYRYPYVSIPFSNVEISNEVEKECSRITSMI
ncbi:hypothetical protein [Vibrio alginolyticus]|uniref:hypothetical protein n=1 Tax=Vibrio alginolyticus TaxID=663 RepID=UPI0004708B78